MANEPYGPNWTSAMTFDEVTKLALSAFPGAYVGQDNDGQFVIYTDICEWVELSFEGDN